MSKVTFGYDAHKDVWSWVRIAQDRDESWGTNWRKENQHIPDFLLEKIMVATKEDAIKIVEKHFSESKYQNFKEKIIQSEIKSLKKVWGIKEAEFFSILEKITNKPIYQKKFPCYFTTGFMCPYKTDEKPNWFMVSIWKGIPFWITTICHEILHLQFINYWREDITNKIGKEKFEILKESLTFLLNEDEFDNIILSENGGYPNHQKLRDQLSKLWRKNRNFEDLIEFGIKYLS